MEKNGSLSKHQWNGMEQNFTNANAYFNGIIPNYWVNTKI
jgi:hypothetical protein